MKNVARTLGLNQAGHQQDNEQAWSDHLKRAVGDQSALAPEEENEQPWGVTAWVPLQGKRHEQAWKDYLNMEWSMGAVGAKRVSFPRE